MKASPYKERGGGASHPRSRIVSIAGETCASLRLDWKASTLWLVLARGLFPTRSSEIQFIQHNISSLCDRSRPFFLVVGQAERRANHPSQ